MKKILFAAAILFMATAVSAADPVPGALALRTFNHAFPGAENVKWSETNENYNVRFTIDGMRHWMVLNKNSGERLFLVRYYQADQLQPDLRRALQREFPNAEITSVTEVSDNYNTVYQVNVSEQKRWHIVLMNDEGNISIKDTFKKNG